MANITNSFQDMFNPYSSVWEVSGTSTPMWSWKFTDAGNGTMEPGFVQYTPSENDADKKTSENTAGYDVRTNNVTAPFSQFSRWQMLDYSGIKGVIYSNDRQLIDRYFDTSLARSGELWGVEDPTYSNIIETYNNIDSGRYRIQDFIYNKYFNMIPTNYLITLRRYGMPCTDAPFTLAYPEEIHKEINTCAALIPMATATTYMSEVAGNKMEDILKFTWGMNFSEKTSEIQDIQSGTPGATSFGFGAKWDNAVKNGGSMRSAFGSGFAMSGLNFLTNSNLTPAQNEIAAQAAQVNPWEKYTKYTQGPVDIIMKTKIRDQGLNFAQDFNLKFEYELKSLQYVNPKIAMLDIIGNMITMTTNSGTFWGGATRYYGNGGGYGKQPGDLAAFARGDYAGYTKSIVDHITNQVSSTNGGWPQDLEDWIALAKNIFTGSMQNMIGSLINGNLGKLGFTQPAHALLNDAPTGYWHVTVGNPLNPISMMGNMICSDMEMTMGEGLGYDDFPVNVAFTCKLSHGKPRDAAGIEALFNAGKGRYMHTPFLAELDQLPPDVKKTIQTLNSQLGIKDPNTITGGVNGVDKQSAISNSTSNVKETSTSTTSTTGVKFSNVESGVQKNLYAQIDNVIRMMR